MADECIALGFTFGIEIELEVELNDFSSAIINSVIQSPQFPHSYDANRFGEANNEDIGGVIFDNVRYANHFSIIRFLQIALERAGVPTNQLYTNGPTDEELGIKIEYDLWSVTIDLSVVGSGPRCKMLLLL